MFRLASALLPVALVGAEQQCYMGDLTIDGKSVPQDEFVEMAGRVASARTASIMKKNKDFHDFHDSQKLCQHSCFGNVFRHSFKGLIGNLGTDVFNTTSAPVAIEALTGAFLACYPAAPRGHVKDAIKQTVKMIDTPADGVELEAKGGACSGPEGTAKEDRDNFMQLFSTNFPPAMKAVLKAHPQVARELDAKKDCEKECIANTVLSSVTNLWDAGMISDPDADELANRALTGAAKACFPSVPQDDMRALMTQIKNTALALNAEAQLESQIEALSDLTNLVELAGPEDDELEPQAPRSMRSSVMPWKNEITQKSNRRQAMPAQAMPAEVMAAEEPQTTYFISIPAACLVGLVAGTVVHFAMLRFRRKQTYEKDEYLLIAA